jgi:hypothetical protein
MDWLLGTVEEQAQRELSEYTPKTGQRKQDWGDIIGDKIFGRKEAIDKAVADLHVSNLTDNYGTQINRYGDIVGGEDVSNLARLTEKQLTNRLSSNRELMGARSEAGAATGEDITTFQDLSTPEAVRARASKLVKDELDDKAGKKEKKDDYRYDESIRRDERIRSEGRLDRNLDKQMNAENNKMQLQLEYARLAQSDRQRTADRKDKAIMALLGGLGNLGAGFTI